jgi:hypothetical protein
VSGHTGQVLDDNVWIRDADGRPVMLEDGAPFDAIPADLRPLIGDHMWVDAVAQANVDPSSGEAKTGLRDNVWLKDSDGRDVMYEKGTIPPAEVIRQIGDHMWADGFTPPRAEVGAVADEDDDAPPDDVAPVAPEASQDEAPADAPDADEDEPAQDEVPIWTAPQSDAVKAPPHSGKGSSEEAWRHYAHQVGVDVSEVSDRASVIALIEAEGKPV